MIEEKVISVSNLETIKKRIKFLEAIDPDDVTLKLLKQQISNNISEEKKLKLGHIY
jgi:hypothetical protein